MRAQQHRKGAALISLLGAVAMLVAGLGLLAAQTELRFASLVGSTLSGLATGFSVIPVPLLIVGALAGAVYLWLRWR